MVVCIFALTAVIFAVSTGQEQPGIGLEDALIRAEENPSMLQQAKQLAIGLGLPVSIVLPSGTVMYPIGVEEDKPVYAVITNPLHPAIGGYVASFEEIGRRNDLSSAAMRFGGKSEATVSPSPRTIPSDGLLLVPDWTADRVWAFDPITGDLVDTAFIHSNSTALASPKQALEHPLWKFVTVSDQITDLVQKFNPDSGTWSGWFAPSGGVNNSILDNIRGHAYRSNNNLLVTVASGSNQNTIAQFDTNGNYLGNFIGQGVGGLNSPFDILFREEDILISQSSSPTGVKMYDLEGAYVSQWASITSFPQQICRMADGRIAVANFSGTGNTGIRIYNPDGTFIRLLSGVTGNRGVYQLPNGNFVTTNSAGIHEIDSTTGNLVRTIQTGTNFQYINLYLPEVSNTPPASFHLLNPADGDTLVEGDTLRYRWEVAVDPDPEDTVHYTLFRSSDGGSTWNPLIVTTDTAYTDPSTPVGMYMWTVSASDGTASTASIETFTYVVRPLVGIRDVEGQRPAGFSLFQNTPNPFNPSTVIRYSLPVASYVTLRVYTVLGQEVIMLVNKEEKAGHGTVAWDGRNSFGNPVGSGMYFYRIEARPIEGGNAFVEIKKMVLLK
jgi:hypothetical protein